MHNVKIIQRNKFYDSANRTEETDLNVTSKSSSIFDEINVKEDSNSSNEKEDNLNNSKGVNLIDRIRSLENENSRLVCFIDFLNKNFPDLLNKLLPQNIVVSLLFEKEKTRAESNRITGKQTCIEPVITKRELEVLKLVATGLCAKEIAQKLYISETTVITHKKNLKAKFQVKNTAELVRKTSTLF